MKKFNILAILLTLISISCTEKKKYNETKTIGVDYILDSTYSKNDVRRYGVFPGKGIGQHPKLLKDKMDVLLDVAESGIKLIFPKGVYERSLDIVGRDELKLEFHQSLFTGSIIIKNSKNISLEGELISQTQFYTKNSQKLEIGNVIITSDPDIKSNVGKSSGFQLHSGTRDVTINKVVVNSLGSDPIKDKYVKAAFISHGHNNEPENISVDSIIINSSDRHGVYLTGKNLNINYVQVRNFGVGSSEGMAPMEGGLDGEQSKFSGIWIKNCFDSHIGFLEIDAENSKADYIYNFDIGEYYMPTTIDTLKIMNNIDNMDKRELSRTGVVVKNLIINE